jgi:hypothetical protein
MKLGVLPEGTRKGRWAIRLELNEDQVQQLIRSMEWAKMQDAHEDEPDWPQRMDVLAHRVFLQEILEELYEAVLVQRH